MSANILRLNQVLDPLGNIGVVTLSTHKNTGATYQDTFTIENAGAVYPMFGLPSVFPLCPWGTILIEVIGCTRAIGPAPILPVPAAGATFPISVFNPITGFAPTVFLPWVPVSSGVLLAPTPRMVHALVPGSNPPTVPPGVLDLLSTPGALYRLNFTVIPHANERGLKRWEFQLTSAGAPVATIAVVASLLSPDHGDSD